MRAVRRYFTEAEDAFIKANYDKISSFQIGKELNRIPSVIRLHTKFLGLKVPADKLEEFKQNCRFQMGHIPKNKGKNVEEYMNAESLARFRNYSYKNGNVPHNQKEADGAITIRKYKGRPYFFIRVKVGVWVHQHRVIWEHHNGPIPKATNIIFKDGNTLNCVIENLEVLTAQELMAKNTIHNLPAELKETIQTRAILNRTIKTTLKNLKNAK